MFYNIKYAYAIARVKKNMYLCKLLLVWSGLCVAQKTTLKSKENGI